MLKYWFEAKLADRGFTTWGFWVRQQYKHNECDECGCRNGVWKSRQLTRAGKLREEYRKLRRMGWKRSAMEAWKHTMYEQVMKRNTLLEYLEKKDEDRVGQS